MAPAIVDPFNLQLLSNLKIFILSIQYIAFHY